MPYRTLDADQIVARVELLHDRITERFGDRGLATVCGELVNVARETSGRVQRIGEPITWLRWSVAAVVAAMAFVAWWLLHGLRIEVRSETFGVFDLAQGIEALTNVVILAAAALIFLSGTERRRKRRLTLAALQELRSLAHVIDSHQLGKDPDRVLGGSTPTASSPRPVLTPGELLRYLNYCSEMLSAIGKLAALYLQCFDDEVAVAAVTEVEDLTLGLSREVWQKVMIVTQDPRFTGQSSLDAV